jgi:hypothetical protein
MEWATGHDRNVYFVLVAQADSDKLALHSTRSGSGNLDMYIANAPTQYLDSTQSPMLCANCKYHRTNRLPTATHTLGGTVASHYAAGGPNNQGPYYRARPTEFGSARDQYTYISSPNDRYASYQSTAYPWIKAVWRYEIQEADPGEWDFAIFFAKQGNVNLPPGDYVMHYLWSGYYDCIDINVIAADVVPGPVPFVYGKPPNGTGIFANRIDHCMFDEPQWYVTLPRPVWGGLEGAISSCVRNCIDSYENGGCGGVQVFPISAISQNWGPHWSPSNNILKTFYDAAWNPNAHWTDGLFPSLAREEGFPYDNTGVLDANNNDIYAGIWRRWEYVPAGSTSYRWTGIHQATVTKLKNFVETGTGQTDPWVCIYVSPRQPTSTIDKYTLTEDPLDPIFYGTCYEVLEQKEFIGINASVQSFSPNIPYQYFSGAGTNSGCISCAQRAKFSIEDYTPDWTIQSKCIRCERDDPNPVWRSKYPKVMLQQVSPGIGTPTATTCVLGNNTVTNVAWANWDAKCLIPHEWTHPLYADNTADPATFIYWRTSVDGPMTGYSNRTTRVGWQPTRTSDWTYLTSDFCSAMVLRDPDCSAYFEWRSDSESTGCRCVRNDPCCLDNLRISSDTTTTRKRFLLEAKAPFTGATDPLLDPTCSRNVTGLRSAADPTLCCKVPSTNRAACGTTGCAATFNTGNTATGAMCRGWQIAADRCCRDYAPPCRVCP